MGRMGPLTFPCGQRILHVHEVNHLERGSNDTQPVVHPKRATVVLSTSRHAIHSGARL